MLKQILEQTGSKTLRSKPVVPAHLQNSYSNLNPCVTLGEEYLRPCANADALI